MSLFEFDAEKRSLYGAICGIDEAGRGCLAGDVFAAAVALDGETVFDGLNDSKKLSPKTRERLYDEITAKSVSYAVASASVEEIEELNILGASLLAMKRAFEKMRGGVSINLALIDGNRTPDMETPVETVTGGDGKSASIAAASILAKVSRDRYMGKLDIIYPEYQFSRHKGYGTRAHYEMIEKFGVCPVHRKSFLKKPHGW
ncbi:MAG: ribonuclease HII [Oscillospiraceae bacterium]|jgi:ribonuclease HII|nr:ribonuclease HII [Oscillospiraceae bacterium]